eukprot:TRINITY_DN353_c0_g1_i5.p1 TRINITY_DN353_c0_g1~~TRINITY_DN353_c0_g1_i5.p1  ORF type:complete len:659 (-),score=81.90 TRINITY_DN353_c0_g1_i5:693-2669(-)
MEHGKLDNVGAQQRRGRLSEASPASSGSCQAPQVHSQSLSGDADCAGGPVRSCSLSNKGFLPTLCCRVPGVAFFSCVAILLIASASTLHFYFLTAVLGILTCSWSTHMALSAMRGVWKTRKACSTNWHALLLKHRETVDEDSDTAHVVILPNFREDEAMLRHTLENIGKSPLARERIRVVLAMEAREVGAQQKAERLIQQTSHLFVHIMASYHPANLPGELAGKSSNTQYAFREVMRNLVGDLCRFDPSKVFLTVGDADTLWHPHFFSALEYSALTMAKSRREWAIWQPPIFLLRNLFSVPLLSRISCYGTIIYELAGISDQTFGSHMSYSAYSLSLALASHPLVGGWDKDVIAEDHHMFCKCYFAALWDSLRCSSTEIMPRVHLEPVMLPAISYLVESDDGWVASCHARFQQARRHSQGVAELSYLLLQYVSFLKVVSFRELPWRTHRGIIALIAKMTMVHIVNSLHAGAIGIMSCALIASVFRRIVAGGFQSIIIDVEMHGFAAGIGGIFNVDSLKWLLSAIGPVPIVCFLMTLTTFLVIKDTLEGRYTTVVSSQSNGEISDADTTEMVPVACDVKGSVRVSAGEGIGTLGFWKCVKLFFSISNEYTIAGEQTIVIYGLVPVTLALWSLMTTGPQFHYVVAAKPNAGSGGWRPMDQ